MTKDEFKLFSRRLFSSFPQIAAWLKDHSPDIPQTLASWESTLSDCNYDECLLAVDDWIHGRSRPPAGYELGYTALKIFESVEDARANDRHEQLFDRRRVEEDARTATYTDRKRLVERRRAGYDPLPQTGSMMAAVEAGRAVMARFRKGEISESDAERMVDEIVKGVE